MADVFIAYSVRDEEWSRSLAAHLVEVGYTVWWDTGLLPGTQFSETIQEEISKARAVVVLWSKNSAESQWVRAEASFAYAQKKLLPFALGEFEIDSIPLPFGVLHTERLGKANSEEFSRVVRGLKNLLGQPAIEGEPRKASVEPELPSDPTLVFVSHIDTDKPRIKEFVERLLERGLNVFIDKPAKFGLDKNGLAAHSFTIYGILKTIDLP